MYNSQTPIDIHCAKLVDWLVQRRHCKKDWGENLANIRRKIKVALKDMPESEDLKQLLINSRLDYFKAKQIVDILKTTEADTKNIFGYYSSTRMKDWQDIVYSYERDYVYLAELCTDLIRETNYEIPGIRRHIRNLHKQKEEAEKEKANLMRRMQQFNSEHQRLAQTYGITGTNVVDELLDQSKSLVHVMSETVELSKGLKDSLEFYREYASATTKLDPKKFLPTLQHIIDNGNTTVYEWKHGQQPEKIISEDKYSSSTNSNPSEIELVNDDIDFGDDLPSSSESSSGFVHVPSGDNTFVQVEDVNDSNEKVARGEDAKLVLESRKSRNQFLNNLHELSSFFKQLLSEDQKESVRFNSKNMNETLNVTRQILDLMNKEKNKVLFQISDSPNFVESINEKFNTKSKQAAECLTKSDMISETVIDIQDQIRESELHLKRSIASAKELQEKVEVSLSELYKGRHINIMGCVS